MRPMVLFRWGLFASLGAVVTVAMATAVYTARDMLIRVLIALFLAISLDPVVRMLTRWRIRRGVAILLVVLVGLGLVAAFLQSVIPAMAGQFHAMVKDFPHNLADLQDRSASFRRTRHIPQSAAAGPGPAAATGRDPTRVRRATKPPAKAVLARMCAEATRATREEAEDWMTRMEREHGRPSALTGLIDVHAHFLTGSYAAQAHAAGHAFPGGMPAWPRWSAAEHLELMDRTGIDAAVLSISSPGVHFGDDKAARRLILYRRGKPVTTLAGTRSAWTWARVMPSASVP